MALIKKTFYYKDVKTKACFNVLYIFYTMCKNTIILVCHILTLNRIGTDIIQFIFD